MQNDAVALISSFNHDHPAILLLNKSIAKAKSKKNQDIIDALYAHLTKNGFNENEIVKFYSGVIGRLTNEKAIIAIIDDDLCIGFKKIV